MSTRIVRAAAPLFAAALASPAFAQAGNPQGSGPIVAALGWLQGTLLGNVATSAIVSGIQSTAMGG
jgi:type IV secretory pathway VirB2 component (pilin)